MEAGSEIWVLSLCLLEFSMPRLELGLISRPIKKICALMDEKEPRGGARGGFQERNHQAVYTVRQYFSRVLQVC